ncbi:hypothetical protein [Aquamicrobium sp.]|uniref:hypothetical protein n=1 Tax=Aquamicrobium sp. TaxID=1872579 RepID=UPI002585EA32|nr:hypothetical protein [Aquamicrobium sp.]MCK9554132.1 hypothetical protein [Aquamicrobium sp.]
MSTETKILTDADIFGIFDTHSDLPMHYEPEEIYAMGRAIEQAVLQSPEVRQAMQDKARLDWLDATNAPFKIGWRFGIAPAGNVQPYTVIQPYGAPTTAREGIDAAMEKKT